MKFLTFISQILTLKHQHSHRLVCALLAACLLFLSPQVIVSAQTTDENAEQPSEESAEQLVHIPDLALRGALEEALGKSAGEDITQAEMATLTSFSGHARGIRDLTGLEYATNLEYLSASYNAIVDISPLRNLIKLRNLGLSNNRIVDVSPLAQLTHLEHLRLSNNRIVDVSAFAELTRLKRLYIAHNQIVDVSAFAELTRLENLYIAHNQIVDVSPFAQWSFFSYGKLDLSNNRIVDVSPFAQADPDYPDYWYNSASLDLRNNQIVDVSPLKSLTNLGGLYLKGNPVTDFSSLAGWKLRAYDFEVVPETTAEGIDIPDPVLRRRIASDLHLQKSLGDVITQTDMERLTNLRRRGGYGSNRTKYGVIRDLTGLEYAKNLESIELNNNEIVDISPLQNLVNLKRLDLRDNQIVNISPLQNLVNLTNLELAGNQIVDIPSFQNLVNLERLNLRDNQIVNISPLQNLVSLTNLDLMDNQIVDIPSFQNLVNLTSLGLSYNQIVDISPLQSLVNLTSLDLRHNQIVDISPLQNLKQLGYLYLEDNPIVDFSMLSVRTLYTDQQPWIPPVSIPDAGLRAVLEEALGKEAGDTITRTDMQTLTTLDASNRDIRDLEGIQYAVNITSLNLTDNQIGDPYRIESLTKLTRLELAGNLLANADCVGIFTRWMPQLTYLDISRNLISTLYADTFDNPKNLTSLNLSDNEIYDVEHLSELTALTNLNLTGNDIEDVSPLAGLTQLTRLFLSNNPATDFSSLYELIPNLLEADFSYQVTELEPPPDTEPTTEQQTPLEPPPDTEPASEQQTPQGIEIPDANLRRVLETALGKAEGDIITQADMETLNRLDANRAGIQDLTGLEYAINLRRLNLARNKISDVSALSGLTKLRRLDLRRNRISDFSAIAGLTDDLTRYKKGNQKTGKGKSKNTPTINADVNRDNVVDATDLDIVSRYEGSQLASVESGLYPDVNGDGKIDTKDVLAVTERLGPSASGTTQ